MINLIRHTHKNRAAVVNFLAAHGGLLVCGLFLLAGLGLVGEYGRGVDELIQREVARDNLRYALGQAERVDTKVPTDRFYGVAYELPLLLSEKVLGSDDYYGVHRFRLTVTHLLFLAGGFFCYLLAYRLFKNHLIALFALLLFLLHPRIYAHSFFNSKDLPFLSMFVIALYLTERAFRKDTLGAFLLLGIAVGIATNLRIMGLMLFLAVVGLRVLDGWLARDWGECKGILTTGGLFALAAGLVWYGLAPNAWGNLPAHLGGAWSLAIDHPAIMPTLFQGELLPSDELPAHYGLTWFMITTPPPALLLGVVGLAAVLFRGLARPEVVFRNARLRFWLLLAGCFGLPLLGVALSGSNIYSEWRQLYFIYVPFVLLAAGGLYWVVGTLSGLRWRRAVIYGLLGFGTGLTLLQMAQLHPLQPLYFNFLVDRSEPGELNARYHLEYRGLVVWDGLAYTLGRHPGEQLAVHTLLGRGGQFLPPIERQRVVFNSPVHDQDYALTTDQQFEAAHLPDLAFNSQYSPVYNSSILNLRGLDASHMDAAAVSGYEAIYREAVAGESIIRGEYDLYLEGLRLTFVKEDCQTGDRAGWFGVKVYGEDAAPGRIPELHSYKYIGNLGVRLGDKCLVALRLPDRPVTHLAAGQVKGRFVFHDGEAVWEAAHSFIRPGLGEMAAALGANRPGVTPGTGFELYRQDNLLIYYREGCTAGDTAAWFFLHISPEDTGDLTAERRSYGFDNRDFYFSRQGVYFDGQCLATAALPDYPIGELRTGQEGYWEFRGLPPVEPGFLRERAAALDGATADWRGEFDLYWRDGELIYRREVCAAADTAAGFFLHITPASVDDLAGERRGYGFESRDFKFARWGGHFDGRCLAVVPLPGYAIAGLRTGQYAAGSGELWSAELGPR